MQAILIINNHDSFVFNLRQLIRESELAPPVVIVSAADIAEVNAADFAGAVISPGAGSPADYPEVMRWLAAYYLSLPVLGVCLGHQMLAVIGGGKLRLMPAPVHGERTLLQKQSGGSSLFTGYDLKAWQVGRYHSLSVQNLPPQLMLTAVSADGEIMAFEHRHYPVFGVQFHPESYLTNGGKVLINNWLQICYGNTGN